MLITCAELARLKGVSRAAVSKKVKAGKLDAAIVERQTVLGDGRTYINKDLALELWEESSSVAFPQSSLVAENKVDLKKKIDSLPEGSVPDFNTSRTKKEYWQSQLAELQVLQQKNEFISVLEVKKSSFEMGRSIRESLANLADRLSSQLAGETDPQVIHKVLSDEHRAVLEQLIES